MTLPSKRAAENPLLVPAGITPSRPDFEVVGVFNPAVCIVEDETILLLRVAEAPRNVPADEVATAVYDPLRGQLTKLHWKREAPGVDLKDPRSIVVHGQIYLSSISHLRIARSRDGIHFDVEPQPALAPATGLEAFGVEDPRMTCIDGTYYINYTAVSSHGIATALASTKDFRSFVRHGILFSPPNRNVTLFPEKIGGRYVALHRPMPQGIGRPSIWIAFSSDLLEWGDHRFVTGPREGSWDDLKVGGGAVPFRVQRNGREAWLAIYHGVTALSETYSLGALLLDASDPGLVLARSKDPILVPEAPYEKKGFFGNVVFTCGAAVVDDTVRIYYGAADGVIARADLSIGLILDSLI